MNPIDCPVCHQPILPQYYFCPNCGHGLQERPLSTSFWSQVGLYLFSIILPSICFIMVTRWKGLKYIRSGDKKSKSIGVIALTLLILSTVFTYWFAVVWTRNIVQTAIDNASLDLGGLIQ
ncbi:MAG: hypothetical protein WCO48_01410 [Candidatus Taylorbacteria bacterium]